jgi:hypothetical protein
MPQARRHSHASSNGEDVFFLACSSCGVVTLSSEMIYSSAMAVCRCKVSCRNVLGYRSQRYQKPYHDTCVVYHNERYIR